MNTILIDCDGVILDWEDGFHTYMQSLGYFKNNITGFLESQYDLDYSVIRTHIRKFNQSNCIEDLPTIDNSTYYMQELKKQNYKFVCITSLSLNKSIQKRRLKNLEKLLGKDFFEDVIFLDTYQPKDNVLKNYANTGYWWIEDNITNAIVGKSLGLQSILFRNNAEGLASVSTWKELYWKIIEHE
jgi:FMN phosphatase YigB (HAD superfamily)|tara:strand:+ start:293 stop:847 length:555 start_codon:yes stop_codon:yes gene_type:complete